MGSGWRSGGQHLKRPTTATGQSYTRHGPVVTGHPAQPEPPHPRGPRHGAKTHVLMSTAWLSRRGDAVSVIGAALLAKATGSGHRPIAAALGRPASTVRGWLRRFSALAEVVRVFFTRLLHSLDPMAGPLLPRDCVFADAVEALGRAGSAGVRRLSPRPPWEFVSWASGGLLLAPGVGQVSNTS
jgi:hypothetical protein